VRNGGVGAAIVIVIRRRKNHCRFCHLGAMNWPDHAVCISAIVATCAVSRKRDGAPILAPFDIAPQQKASHIAAALRTRLARFSSCAHRDTL
jgi:hypothetical protein